MDKKFKKWWIIDWINKKPCLLYVLNADTKRKAQYKAKNFYSELRFGGVNGADVLSKSEIEHYYPEWINNKVNVISKETTESINAITKEWQKNNAK